ncbi:MAG: hypothetical protein Q8P41_05575 [Pseudomonadota bacterium]|nr:hypothetical protein [Pseudomonadota bacterium]
MAEKKKSPSTARPRGAKPTTVASATPVAPAVPVAEVTVAAAAPVVVSAPVVATAPVAVAPAVVSAPAVAIEPVAVEPVEMLVGIEVDARPTIHMPPPPRVVTHDMIAHRANEIHRTRGGSAFDNWIEAERELGAH